MAAHRIRLGAKGRVVLPAHLRRALGVQVGDRLLLRLIDGEVRITSPAAAVREAQRAVRRYVVAGPSMVDELVAERRAEAAREEPQRGGRPWAPSSASSTSRTRTPSSS